MPAERVHLHGVASGQRSYEETSQRWRDCVKFDLHGNRTQPSRTDSNVFDRRTNRQTDTQFNFANSDTHNNSIGIVVRTDVKPDAIVVAAGRLRIHLTVMESATTNI